MNAHGYVTVACGACLCVSGQGLPVVRMCWEGMIVRACLPLLLPHPCSHLALISRSLGRESRFRMQENVPGSGHCAGPAPAPPAEIVPAGGGRECRDRIKGGGVALGSPFHGIKQDKLMGSSGHPGTWRLLPKSFNAGKLRANKRRFLFLSGSLSGEV